jgi:Flp pilus assembly protein TadG
MQRTIRRLRRNRDGSIAVLACFFMIVFVAMVAFAVDLGYMNMAHVELQRTADAAALAATWELIDNGPLQPQPDLSQEIANARAMAVTFAAANPICNQGPTVDPNGSNDTSGDVVVGYLSDPRDPNCQMTFTDPNRFNAVQVTIRRTAASNGEVPYYFARVLGHQGRPMSLRATAALLNNINGFTAPSNGDTLGILPITIDEYSWNELLAGNAPDNWKWENGNCVPGQDGVRELNLYPQGTGSPGNRGTVDIGSPNNSTADLSRQVLNGVNATDMSYFPDSELKFNDSGELYLNGDTGISAGIKDELAAIKGLPRMIPVFRSVTGNGNNANYTIIAWVGIRIMNVNLTGSMSSKQVIIQPCKMMTLGGLPNDGPQASYGVYSPVWLVR